MQRMNIKIKRKIEWEVSSFEPCVGFIKYILGSALTKFRPLEITLGIILKPANWVRL